MTDGAPGFQTLHDDLVGPEPVDEGCGHADARRIRLHLPYAQANVVRLRYTELVDAHVWPLRRVGGAWTFRVCRVCAGTARARTA